MTPEEKKKEATELATELVNEIGVKLKKFKPTWRKLQWGCLLRLTALVLFIAVLGGASCGACRATMVLVERWLT